MQDVQSHLARAGIAKYKWPEEIRSHDFDFPRTATGKVRKADLRNEVRGAAT
jgi:non-ribosomal peptide synthetase component E (peptide arylation enzyme)